MIQEALFEGLTVLDASQGIAGPYCGLILRQQGARVIKVEPPAGDWGRGMGRQLAGHTAISIAFNAGKESVVLDARNPDQKAALRQLAAQADVVIQNFRPGVAERMGIGYADLAPLQPRQVYVSVSGYGATGPRSARPALDTTVQAETGLMWANQDAAGQPRRIGLYLVDLSTGLHAAQAASAALYRAALSGRGRHVEVSMLQVAAALQSYQIIDKALFPDGGAVVFNAPAGLFPTRDGQIYISMLNDAMFQRLCEVLGMDDWRDDASLRTSAGRIARATELNARLAGAIRERSTDAWMALLESHDILCGRVRSPHDLLQDPQARHLGLFAQVSQAGVGALPWVRLPGQCGVSPEVAASPLLGQHTQAVLQEFGIKI
ncbi:CaiB/BaiF CoA transferase family protein [Bordetella petrii]|uniref:CaiB/BaiF CoA transferase family protein n=1 Tax=Bordetella petrii TaxID=94624 RepID=UPI001E5F6A48|nr:CoA transferase [Bordetella petrii]MCD0502503.1 CoA transferase [Bordetella petrii]